MFHEEAIVCCSVFVTFFEGWEFFGPTLMSTVNSVSGRDNKSNAFANIEPVSLDSSILKDFSSPLEAKDLINIYKKNTNLSNKLCDELKNFNLLFKLLLKTGFVGFPKWKYFIDTSEVSLFGNKWTTRFFSFLRYPSRTLTEMSCFPTVVDLCPSISFLEHKEKEQKKLLVDLFTSPYFFFSRIKSYFFYLKEKLAKKKERNEKDKDMENLIEELEKKVSLNISYSFSSIGDEWHDGWLAFRVHRSCLNYPVTSSKEWSKLSSDEQKKLEEEFEALLKYYILERKLTLFATSDDGETTEEEKEDEEASEEGEGMEKREDEEKKEETKKEDDRRLKSGSGDGKKNNKQVETKKESSSDNISTKKNSDKNHKKEILISSVVVIFATSLFTGFLLLLKHFVIMPKRKK